MSVYIHLTSLNPSKGGTFATFIIYNSSSISFSSIYYSLKFPAS